VFNTLNLNNYFSIDEFDKMYLWLFLLDNYVFKVF
jgi:hypothetical protein